MPLQVLAGCFLCFLFFTCSHQWNNSSSAPKSGQFPPFPYPDSYPLVTMLALTWQLFPLPVKMLSNLIILLMHRLCPLQGLSVPHNFWVHLDCVVPDSGWDHAGWIELCDHKWAMTERQGREPIHQCVGSITRESVTKQKVRLLRSTLGFGASVAAPLWHWTGKEQNGINTQRTSNGLLFQPVVHFWCFLPIHHT